MKKLLSIILICTLVICFNVFCVSAETLVHNTAANVADTYTLSYGSASTINGLATVANKNDNSFIAMTVAGPRANNSLYRTIASYIYGSTSHTKTFRILTYKASNVGAGTIDGLTITSLSSGVNINANESYVELGKTYTSKITSDVYVKSVTSTSSGYYACPSIGVGI